MSVSVPDDLYDRIIDALPYGEVRDELIALTNRSNVEQTINITVPERMAAHFASAFSIGAATAKMCSGHPESVKALRDASKAAEAMIPAAFDVFLHRTDVEKVMDALVFGNGQIVVVEKWRTGDLVLKREGKRDWSPMLSSRDDLSVAEAERIAEELNAFAERCRQEPAEATAGIESPEY